MSKTVTVSISALLLINIIVAPVFATRTIDVTKDVGVEKNLLATQLTDLKSYKEIFPVFVKSVEIEPNTNRAKFIVEAQGRSEAEVQSTVQPDGTFVVEILSGDLKGSKIMTTLKDRVGFDGTPKGATTVKMTMILETSPIVTIGLTFVSDDQINKAVGDGFYELGEYVKSKHPAQKEQSVNVDYKGQTKSKTVEKFANIPKHEAARALDPEKESIKFQTGITQTIGNMISALKNFFKVHV